MSNDTGNGWDYIIFDFETMGQRPNAVILSCGITCGMIDPVDCTFENLISRGKEWIFYAQEQVKEPLNRKVDQSTVDWWNKQGDDARRIFQASDKMHIHDFPRALWDYCHEHPLKKGGMILVRGPSFDMPMLDNLLDSLEIESPFPWYAVRDVRTIIDVAFLTTNGYPPGKKKFLNEMHEKYDLVKHNALHDVILDSMMVVSAYQEIYGGDEE